MVRLVLFDVDGTLVHTGGGWHGGRSPRLCLGISTRNGSGKNEVRRAHRCQPGPRIFPHSRPRRATTENFRPVLRRHYVFWLASHPRTKGGGEICRGVRELSATCRRCPILPCWACSPATSSSVRKSSCATSACGKFLNSAGLLTTMKTATHIAAAALKRGRRVLGKNLQPEEIVVVGDTPFDIRCGSPSARKCWPWPPAARSWTN